MHAAGDGILGNAACGQPSAGQVSKAFPIRSPAEPSRANRADFGPDQSSPFRRHLHPKRSRTVPPCPRGRRRHSSGRICVRTLRQRGRDARRLGGMESGKPDLDAQRDIRFRLLPYLSPREPADRTRAAIAGHQILAWRGGSRDRYSSTPSCHSTNAISSAASFKLSQRPDLPPCPAPMLVLSTSTLSSVLVARSLAAHFAGSQ